MSAGPEALRQSVAELEQAAARLRSGEVTGDEATALVERCAELAARISAALDEEARSAAAELPLDESPEQERLL